MGNIISSFLDVFTNPNFYANVLAVTPPILLAALGCSIAQKSGLVQMGMEGIMLLSSFLGTLAAAYIGGPNPWLGLLVGLVVGVVNSLSKDPAAAKEPYGERQKEGLYLHCLITYSFS